MAARREKKALKEQAKADAKAKKASDKMKAIQAIKEVSEPIPAIEEVLEDSLDEEQELQVNEETQLVKEE